jgi:superfamily II DNA or RNA helicase
MMRTWQRDAREAYHLSGAPDWLLEATPGAGKTRVALLIARDWLAGGLVRRIAVVCPTAHLRRQWADAAAALGLALDPDPRPDGREGPDFHGAISTYQQVAIDPTRHAALAQACATGLICDEIHHAGDGLAWGEALRQAYTPAVRRLALSGTPFRSDDARIPFVRYGPDGSSLPDFRYGYEAALRDGVCRPLVCPAYGGVVSWQRDAGPIRTVGFREAVRGQAARDRLRAAVLSDEWLATVLAAAHRTLSEARGADPTAGGLVVASSQAHARRIAASLAALTGEPPALAVSDDPEASATIRRFRASTQPWLVAVNMVSEGVDVPRLRVGVYATTVTTALYFRQVAGRLVRRRPHEDARTHAWLYLPSDPTLLAYARALDAARSRAMAPRSDEIARSSSERGPRSATAFTPLGGLAWSQAVITPAGVPGGLAPGASPVPPPLFERRDRLRTRHHRLVGLVARRHGLAHRFIHAELTRRFGGRVEDAGVEQLEARLAVLAEWLDGGLYR